MTQTSTGRYQELDAMRGLAAILVVFFHFTMGKPEANLGFNLGASGIDLFFMISGFVIFLSVKKASSSTDFLINRVSRLYPTYWFAVTFTFLLISAMVLYTTHSTEGIPFKKYFGNLTMIQYYLHISNLDGPYWTLSIELFFYLSIYMACRLNLLKYTIPILLLTTLIAVTLSLFFKETYLSQKIFFKITFFQFTPLFLAGITFFHIHENNSFLKKYYSIIILCFISQTCLYPVAGSARIFMNHYEYTIMLSIYFLLFILFINNLLKLIVNKITLYLGKISYSLYLIHQAISVDYLIPFYTQKLNINFWITVIFLTLPIVLLLSSLINFYVEIPASKKMKAALKIILKKG